VPPPSVWKEIREERSATKAPHPSHTGIGTAVCHAPAGDSGSKLRQTFFDCFSGYTAAVSRLWGEVAGSSQPRPMGEGLSAEEKLLVLHSNCVHMRTFILKDLVGRSALRVLFPAMCLISFKCVRACKQMYTSRRLLLLILCQSGISFVSILFCAIYLHSPRSFVLLEVTSEFLCWYSLRKTANV